jgi:hypothetical protein
LKYSTKAQELEISSPLANNEFLITLIIKEYRKFYEIFKSAKLIFYVYEFLVYRFYIADHLSLLYHEILKIL